MAVWVIRYNEKKDVFGDTKVFSTSEKALEYLMWFMYDLRPSVNLDSAIAQLQEDFANDTDFFGIDDFAWAEKIEVDDFN